MLNCRFTLHGNGSGTLQASHVSPVQYDGCRPWNPRGGCCFLAAVPGAAGASAPPKAHEASSIKLMGGADEGSAFATAARFRAAAISALPMRSPPGISSLKRAALPAPPPAPPAPAIGSGPAAAAPAAF